MQAGSPLKVGDVVAGAYVVERLLGAGGMAYVALAAHTEQRHRVAIKILRPENSRKTEVVKRFEREQRTLATLHSEHTLRIYGFGTHEGLPYMLIEYLQGKDLGELIKAEGPLPIDRAVEYVLQACHAIAEAHLLGIVHRDIKPGNLFLTRRTDGSPCIKVLDFGISKVSQELDGLGEPSLVTKAHAVMGSPFYMSPEQMLSSASVDARSDVWSLGVTLYELLTKTLPFAAESTAAVCARIMGDEPTPLRKLRPNYPLGLDEAIGRCLKRKLDLRFANVADLAVRLGDFAPAHSQFAIKAICDLVAPTEPYDIESTTLRGATLRMPEPEGAASASAVSTNTTVYLPQGDGSGGGWKTGAVLGVTALAFGVGVGLGWVLNLDTDPTHDSLVTNPPPRAISAAPGATAGPAAPNRTAQPEGPRSDATTNPPIDLDGGGSEAAGSKAGARAATPATGGSATTPEGRSTPAAKPTSNAEKPKAPVATDVTF